MEKILKVLMLFVLSAICLNGFSADDKNEKVLNRYREEVNGASPDDWYTLATCAKQCMKKDIMNKEVAEWIDRSLEIKRTAYNLEIKGDYFLLNRLPDEAGKFYLEALQVGFEDDPDFDPSGIQSKIADMVDLKT